MDNIIKVDFGLPFVSLPETPNVTEAQDSGARSRERCQAFDRLFRRIGTNLLPELRIKMHLTNIGAVRPTENYIGSVRQGLKEHTLDQLRDIARKSTEVEWNARPGYFYSLIEEINAKGGL